MQLKIKRDFAFAHRGVEQGQHVGEAVEAADRERNHVLAERNQLQRDKGDLQAENRKLREQLGLKPGGPIYDEVDNTLYHDSACIRRKGNVPCDCGVAARRAAADTASRVVLEASLRRSLGVEPGKPGTARIVVDEEAIRRAADDELPPYKRPESPGCVVTTSSSDKECDPVKGVCRVPCARCANVAQQGEKADAPPPTNGKTCLDD